MPVNHNHLKLIDCHERVISTILDFRCYYLISGEVNSIQGDLISLKINLTHQREIENARVFMSALLQITSYIKLTSSGIQSWMLLKRPINLIFYLFKTY
jgi:hypothetical protein